MFINLSEKPRSFSAGGCQKGRKWSLTKISTLGRYIMRQCKVLFRRPNSCLRCHFSGANLKLYFNNRF